jgi:hypothetical protein
MKTTLALIRISLIALTVAGAATLAQDNESNADSAVKQESPDATTVVYEAPVTYYEPVVYQASVVYNAPVYYGSAPSTPVDAGPLADAPLSTVLVIGAPGGSYGYGHAGASGETVVPFGQRGGWFGGR